MASEIRVNQLTNRAGLGTITFANGGVQFSGITTFANGEFYVGTGATIINPSTNEFNFHTGGSNRLTINNSGVSIPGALSYEDVKNVDSVGVVTVRSGGYLDVRTGGSINTNATGGSASGTLHKNTTSGEFAVVSGGTGGNNYLSFYTSASAAPTEKFRIEADGHTQIGLIGLSGGNDHGLTITEPGGTSNVLELATGNATGRINLSRNLSSTLNTTSYISWTEPGAQGTGEIRFGTSPSSNSPVDRLFITSTGLVTQKGTWTNTYIGTATTQCGYQVQNLSGTTNTYAALRLTAGDTSAATAQLSSIRTGAGANDFAIQLEASNTAFEALRIKSSGKMGLGTNNPDCLLHVMGTEISGYGAHANTKLCVEHDGNTAVEIVSGTNYSGGIYFSDSGADGVGKIEYYHGTGGDNMRFNTNGSEKLRIDSSGNVAIGYTVAYHNYASGATGTNTKLAAVHTTGTGWKEMAHFAAGTDSDDTGSVVRISHFGNDRGAYLKAGRGSSDRAIAYFGLRNSANTDTDLLTFRQDSGEYRTITNSEFRFNTPTNAERAIVAYGNHSTSYNLGSTGGAAIRFKNTSGSHSIEFDTHWSGTHHSTAMTLGRSGSLITRDSRDASVGRDYTSGTLTNGQSVSYNGSGTTLTNGKLNLNSVGGNAGGWIGCLSISSTDGNPSGASIICGVHGQGFNVYNKLLDTFDSGITVTWASGNWSYQISNSSGDTIKYRFTVIHMGTQNTTLDGR